jgi:hypothetical protein
MKVAPPRSVGQVGNLRRIGTPPAGEWGDFPECGDLLFTPGEGLLALLSEAANLCGRATRPFDPGARDLQRQPFAWHSAARADAKRRKAYQVAPRQSSNIGCYGSTMRPTSLPRSGNGDQLPASDSLIPSCEIHSYPNRVSTRRGSPPWVRFTAVRFGGCGSPLASPRPHAAPCGLPGRRPQNRSRNPNCMRRGPINVDVILPTFALVMLRFAGPYCV